MWVRKKEEEKRKYGLAFDEKCGCKKNMD